MNETLMKRMRSFDPVTRRDALTEAAAAMRRRGPAPLRLNLHMHSFFSFNAGGDSPSALAWHAADAGFYAAAICDFDVLTGLDEFLHAGDRLQLRSAVAFESRTLFREYADQVINSPGEPGVFYFMGMGFVREPDPDSDTGRAFAALLAEAHRRNRALVTRVNAALGDLDVDYDRDVLPLTPMGNATERHIVQAYHTRALACHGDLAGAGRYWAARLDLDPAALSTESAFLGVLRARLMKQGGLGYAPPGPDTFPALDGVIETILACEAMPMTTWLDGTNAGEQDPATQLECLVAKGVAGANIIPDRNWNLPDPDTRRRKIKELHRYARAVAAFDLPLNVGTELNKLGQPDVDDFEAEPLRPLVPLFLQGAQVVIGHTRLLRYAGFGYTGAAARNEFADRKRRNQVFAGVGALPAPNSRARNRLGELGKARAYAYLMDAAAAGTWP